MVWRGTESALPGAVFCWGGGVSEPKPCPPDLAHEQLLLVRPVLPAGGPQGTGRQRAHLPLGLPPKSTPNHCFAARRNDGTDHVIPEPSPRPARHPHDPTLTVLDPASTAFRPSGTNTPTRRDPKAVTA